MNTRLFEIKERTGRVIYMTRERWKHIISPISPHAYMTNYLEEIKQTLINPDKITNSINSDTKVNYYKYYKGKRQCLKIVVNYLNGNGFVITAYFVKNIG